MTTLDERFQKGIETRTKFGGGTLTGGSVPTAWDVAPDLQRIAGEFLFGSIWHRPALQDKQREMITVTILTVLKRDNQVRRHLGNALNLGLTPIEIVEVLMHSSFYSGVPATLDALAIAKEVFDEKGVDYTPQKVFDATETPDDLYNRGVARRIEYMGPSGGGQGPVTQAEREFNRLGTEYYWGSIWTRPGLELIDRSICTMAALTALGKEAQLASHIRGALNIGLTQEQIIEVFIHATFYCGLPAVRSAIDLANEIFRSR
ncbi:MAG: carboxymuconolactone decarboxylase family protein [SAR202 cluster bacterium]|nr:carboxymuconolactone decarboxylase family protein [SAR202 cluster bacterium]